MEAMPFRVESVVDAGIFDEFVDTTTDIPDDFVFFHPLQTLLDVLP